MAKYYVDYENVKSDGLESVVQLTEDDTVYIFYSENANHLRVDIIEQIRLSKAHIEFIKVEAGIPNALDFQLITALFCQYEKGETYYIISKDNGYLPAIHMAAKLGFDSIYKKDSIRSNDQRKIAEPKTKTVEQPVNKETQLKEQTVRKATQPKEQPVKKAAQPKEQPVKKATQPKEQPVKKAAQPKEQPVKKAAQPKEQPVKKAAKKQSEGEPQIDFKTLKKHLVNTYHKEFSQREIDIIANALKRSSNRQQFYITFTKSLGMANGKELYTLLRAGFQQMRAMVHYDEAVK